MTTDISWTLSRDHVTTSPPAPWEQTTLHWPAPGILNHSAGKTDRQTEREGGVWVGPEELSVESLYIIINKLNITSFLRSVSSRKVTV